MPKYTVKEFDHALRVSYSNLNFDQFCELIKEPTTYNGVINDYAMRKFHALTDLASAVSTLNQHFATIVEHGMKEVTNA